MADSYNNIGGVYLQKGDLENALLQYQRALEIRTRVFGSEHPDVAKSRNGIGNVLKRMGKPEEALVQYQKALEVFLALFGQEHPSVATSYVNIGAVYGQKGDLENALLQFEKALGVPSRVWPGTPWPRFMETLATSLVTWESPKRRVFSSKKRSRCS